MLLAFAFWAFIGEEVTPGALLAAALALPAAFALTFDFAFTLALAFALGAAVSKNLSQLMGQLLLEKPVLQILVLVQVEAKASIASGGQASSWGYQQGRQVTSNFNLEHQCATWMVHALVHLTYFPTFHQKSSPHTKDLVHVSNNHCAIYHSQKVLHEIFLFLDGNMFLWNEYFSYACNTGKQYLKICCDFKKWFVFKNINKINKYINRKIKHIYIYIKNE